MQRFEAHLSLQVVFVDCYLLDLTEHVLLVLVQKLGFFFYQLLGSLAQLYLVQFTGRGVPGLEAVGVKGVLLDTARLSFQV